MKGKTRLAKGSVRRLLAIRCEIRILGSLTTYHQLTMARTERAEHDEGQEEIDGVAKTQLAALEAREGEEQAELEEMMRQIARSAQLILDKHAEALSDMEKTAADAEQHQLAA